jgi:hypothetical protein
MMSGRRSFHGLDDMVIEIAARKTRAGQARRDPPPSAETSREVYQASCDRIGNSLSALGFRYARSGPHARRNGEHFEHRIGMQSSHNNVAGEYVQLILFASVWSKRFAQWRAKLPFPTATWGRIAGRNVGYLRSGGNWIEWNLASPAQRDATISDAESAIRELAIPYFELFEDRDRLVGTLKHGILVGLDPHNAVELLLWLGEREAAAAHVRVALSTSEGIAASYKEKEESARIRRVGVQPLRFQYVNTGKALAYLVRAHDLAV